jgi:hypothetical protein
MDFMAWLFENSQLVLIIIGALVIYFLFFKRKKENYPWKY